MPRPYSSPSSPSSAVLPPMNALEILRETSRLLRSCPSPFLTLTFSLILPVSAASFSSSLAAASFSSSLAAASFSRSAASSLSSLAAAAGLPRHSQTLYSLALHLASSASTAALCLPLYASLLLAARAGVAYAVACLYAGKKFNFPEFASLFRRSWRRLLCTYACLCVSISVVVVAFISVLFALCSAVSVLMYPPEVVGYVGFGVMLAFAVAYAHTVIVCNLAGVIAALEELSGVAAILRAVKLVRGQTQVGLVIFLGSTIGLAFVEGLFEHRVKTLSYGDGSSRLWEGPLLAVMYSFVVLIDSMMSAVFYFTCRSSCLHLFYGEEEDEHNVLVGKETKLDVLK